jgi:gluconokinase
MSFAGNAECPAIVIMGVTGCGKSAVGQELAERLGARFIEGDSLHPPENIARMSAGIPLTDGDRAGWLERIAAEIAAARASGEAVVATCSALKRSYRDRLRAPNPGLVFIFLDIDRETALHRVAARKGHFMPASLVDSQFADLEPPTPDERALALDASYSIGELVSASFVLLTGAGGTAADVT